MLLGQLGGPSEHRPTLPRAGARLRLRLRLRLPAGFWFCLRLGFRICFRLGFRLDLIWISDLALINFDLDLARFGLIWIRISA